MLSGKSAAFIQRIGKLTPNSIPIPLVNEIDKVLLPSRKRPRVQAKEGVHAEIPTQSPRVSKHIPRAKAGQPQERQ